MCTTLVKCHIMYNAPFDLDLKLGLDIEPDCTRNCLGKRFTHVLSLNAYQVYLKHAIVVQLILSLQ